MTKLSYDLTSITSSSIPTVPFTACESFAMSFPPIASQVSTSIRQSLRRTLLAGGISTTCHGRPSFPDTSSTSSSAALCCSLMTSSFADGICTV